MGHASVTHVMHQHASANQNELRQNCDVTLAINLFWEIYTFYNF